MTLQLDSLKGPELKSSRPLVTILDPNLNTVLIDVSLLHPLSKDQRIFRLLNSKW